MFDIDRAINILKYIADGILAFPIPNDNVCDDSVFAMIPYGKAYFVFANRYVDRESGPKTLDRRIAIKMPNNTIAIEDSYYLGDGWFNDEQKDELVSECSKVGIHVSFIDRELDRIRADYQNLFNKMLDGFEITDEEIAKVEVSQKEIVNYRLNGKEGLPEIKAGISDSDAFSVLIGYKNVEKAFNQDMDAVGFDELTKKESSRKGMIRREAIRRTAESYVENVAEFDLYRSVRRAMTDAKLLNVTFKRDDVEASGKMKPINILQETMDSLTTLIKGEYPNRCYTFSSWDFETGTVGRKVTAIINNPTPQDIVKITYGKKVIWERKTA